MRGMTLRRASAGASADDRMQTLPHSVLFGSGAQRVRPLPLPRLDVQVMRPTGHGTLPTRIIRVGQRVHLFYKSERNNENAPEGTEGHG
jgi:hypothetical protein